MRPVSGDMAAWRTVLFLLQPPHAISSGCDDRKRAMSRLLAGHQYLRSNGRLQDCRVGGRKGRVMKCEICGAENPPSMNHTSMHTCICVDCCRDQKPEWQKRAEEAEVELAKALAEIEQLNKELSDIAPGVVEDGVKIFEQKKTIEQTRKALKKILKIKRTIDMNLFDIEEIHSIAQAALSAIESEATDGK